MTLARHQLDAMPDRLRSLVDTNVLGRKTYEEGLKLGARFDGPERTVLG